MNASVSKMLDPIRIITLLLHMAVVTAIFWVRAEIRDELKHYVSKHEFQTYQDNHEKWGDQVVRRLQTSADECNRRLDRIEAKVDRLMEKRAEIVPNQLNGLKK